jgi:dTDP-glucose 4,6-dehydratase
MNILVTGGYGFIGSNFIRYWLNKYPEDKIINLDKLTYAGNPKNLKDIEENKKYTFIRGDICNKETVDKVMKEVDVVYHFAAESHVDNSIKGSFVFTETNVFGTHVLLETAKQNKIKKFIHISTDEVYGSIEKDSFSEKDILKPNSPYSASKAAAEMLVRSYNKTFNLPTIITRSSNNFGPYQYPEKLIPLFVTNLMENIKVPVYGTGKNVRDWIYVLDNCEGIDFASKKGEIGEIYNIGGGNEISNIEITKLILKEMGKDEAFITYVQDRLGHDFRYSLDCSKIRKLGWKPKYDFEKAMKETISWYKQNEKWWKPLKKR